MKVCNENTRHTRGTPGAPCTPAVHAAHPAHARRTLPTRGAPGTPAAHPPVPMDSVGGAGAGGDECPQAPVATAAGAGAGGGQQPPGAGNDVCMDLGFSLLFLVLCEQADGSNKRHAEHPRPKKQSLHRLPTPPEPSG